MIRDVDVKGKVNESKIFEFSDEKREKLLGKFKNYKTIFLAMYQIIL
jgi:hypothetical protein